MRDNQLSFYHDFLFCLILCFWFVSFGGFVILWQSPALIVMLLVLTVCVCFNVPIIVSCMHKVGRQQRNPSNKSLKLPFFILLAYSFSLLSSPPGPTQVCLCKKSLWDWPDGGDRVVHLPGLAHLPPASVCEPNCPPWLPLSAGASRGNWKCHPQKFICRLVSPSGKLHWQFVFFYSPLLLKGGKKLYIYVCIPSTSDLFLLLSWIGDCKLVIFFVNTLHPNGAMQILNT